LGALQTHSYILTTAGHVDHGKSSLVKTLTGIDPDRLPEEKARGITIDLGFAHLALPAPDHPEDLIHLGIVDVPGHEDFVKNMVSGVGAADLALLVVAADDGWMSQTEEHLQILQYLGVHRGVVALTKIDLAGSESEAIANVRQKLAGTPFSDSPIVATSVVSGRGIEELKLALAMALENVAPQRDIGKPRLSVDRVFTLKGAGTVATGTLTGGSLKRGQNVLVQPAGNAARIRTLQTHNCDVEVAVPGTRVALNLPQLQVGGRGIGEASSISRGDVITIEGLGSTATTADVIIERSGRTSAESPAGRPIKDGTLIRFHHGTANVPARIHFQNVQFLLPGQRAFAQLRFDEPVFVFADDRFLIRDWPDRDTLAGGKVLDPQASRQRLRSPERGQKLTKLAEAKNVSDRILACLTTQPVAPRPALLAQSHFSAAEVEEAIRQLASHDALVATEKIVIAASWWKQLCQRAVQLIDQFHQTAPNQPGMEITGFRRALEQLGLAEQDAFEALLDHLVRDGFVRVGVAIGRASHRPALPPSLQSAGEKIRTLLNARPLDPPSRKELAPDSASFQALKFLLCSGEAIDVGPDLVLAREHYLRAVELIQNHIRSRGPASVAELRQALNTTRRIMVPLLEKLDREGITRREGDRRILRH
jgi:selenocysteine-specific elongation factor